MADLTLIQAQTLVANAASISFTGIPATYKSLLAIGMVRSTDSAGSPGVSVQFNADTGNNYAYCPFGTGATTTNVTGKPAGYVAAIPLGTSPGGLTSCFEMMLEDYLSTALKKSFVTLSANAGGPVYSYTTSWTAAAAAVNRIDFVVYNGTSFGNYASGSMISLYGLS